MYLFGQAETPAKSSVSLVLLLLFVEVHVYRLEDVDELWMNCKDIRGSCS